MAIMVNDGGIVQGLLGMLAFLEIRDAEASEGVEIVVAILPRKMGVHGHNQVVDGPGDDDVVVDTKECRSKDVGRP